MKEKTCFFGDNICNKEDCELWDHPNAVCCIKSIAYFLYELNTTIDDLIRSKK